MLLGQKAIVDFFLENEGTDEQGSGFIFNFQAFQAMLHCRDALRNAHPEAFHAAGAGLKMAEAWIVEKTAVVATDYTEDVGFFVNV